MKKYIALVALLALFACSAQASGTGRTTAVVGRPAPSFSEQTASGAALSLASFRGKAVYLNFFASWCGPCNEEAPDINALAKRYAPRGLDVVGVDVLEGAKQAQAFIKEHHLVYPAIVDNGTLRSDYAIDGLPVHAFIDRDGVLRKLEIGELSKAEMEADIKSIL